MHNEATDYYGDYTLAEAALLSKPWVNASTAPDLPSRSILLDSSNEPLRPVFPKVMRVRRDGTELRVEFYSTPIPPALLKTVEGVFDLLALRPGWNSYSAKPITLTNAKTAIEVVARLFGQDILAPNIVPRVQGGIQLEWHAEGGDVEIYIDSPERVSVFAEHAESGKSLEGPLAGHEQELTLWLKQISRM